MTCTSAVQPAGRRRPALARLIRAQFQADLAVPGRRGLQLCLALIWLLDAALQFQPVMFGPWFVRAVIEPAAAGNPTFVRASVTWAGHLMLHQVAAFNAAFATIQLLIAAGLAVRRTVRPALALSVIWSLSVWWFGEGLGGVLAGSTPLAGVPGAALLYALLAVLVWPSAPRPDGPSASPGGLVSVAAASPAGAAAVAAWVALWGGLAHFLLLPANRAPGSIAGLLSQTGGQPRWLAGLMTGLAGAAAHRGPEISIVLAAACGGIAVGALARPLIGPALALAAAMGVLLWIAEGLGGVFTGQGTDPNTGPLLIVLAACFLPRGRRHGQWPAEIGHPDPAT